jgi:hypothetical protein
MLPYCYTLFKHCTVPYVYLKHKLVSTNIKITILLESLTSEKSQRVLEITSVIVQQTSYTVC